MHLRVLEGILNKKIDILRQILNITENQQTILSAGPHGKNALHLYRAMNDEKQKLIDTVNESNRVFEKTYQNIREVFAKEAHNHAGLVACIQDRIKRVTDLDVRIRVLEARNIASAPAANKARDNKSTRKRLVRLYEKNKTNEQPPG